MCGGCGAPFEELCRCDDETRVGLLAARHRAEWSTLLAHAAGIGCAIEGRRGPAFGWRDWSDLTTTFLDLSQRQATELATETVNRIIRNLEAPKGNA